MPENKSRQDRITAKDVRASMSKQVRQLFVMKYIARPVANLITPVFYNAGWSANQVTAFRGVVAVIAVAILSVNAYWAAIAAVAGYYIVYILDCIDGNLARLSNSATYWGKFTDGMVDLIFRATAPLVLAYSYYQSDGVPAVAAIGVLATVSLITNQFVRARFSFMRDWMIAETGPIEPQTQNSLARLKYWTGLTTAWYSNAFFFAPLCLLVPEYGAPLFLLALIFVQLIPDAIWFLSSLKEAHAILRRGRRSIHAPTDEELAAQQNTATDGSGAAPSKPAP